MNRRRAADPHRTYEVRCPVHGFIELNDWEREIIAQPAFQRLRRIRQLAWTDQVYPGAMHTRFEHSLGVMHTATLLYDSVARRSLPTLESELAYNKDGLKRHRALVRLAALLHDVGHGPFSHAAEDLLPPRGEGGEAYKHEDYSAAVVRRHFRDVIENHRLNRNYDLRAEDVASLIEGSTGAGRAAFWRELISGQMDADRMDYLLRDSRHAGVQYGRFDLGRLVRTVQVAPGVEGEGPRLGISEGGWHAAEGLILARYFMFTQVYFHKTRIAFDHHLHEALKKLLPNGCFPLPEGDALDSYLQWDDWRVLGMLADGQGESTDSGWPHAITTARCSTPERFPPPRTWSAWIRSGPRLARSSRRSNPPKSPGTRRDRATSRWSVTQRREWLSLCRNTRAWLPI